MHIVHPQTYMIGICNLFASAKILVIAQLQQKSELVLGDFRDQALISILYADLQIKHWSPSYIQIYRSSIDLYFICRSTDQALISILYADLQIKHWSPSYMQIYRSSIDLHLICRSTDQALISILYADLQIKH